MGAINPFKLLIISIAIWIFFYIQIDVDYIYEGSAFFPILTLLGYIVIFVIGIYSLKKENVLNLKTTSSKKIKQIVFLFFVVGTIGVFFKMYSGFFNSGIYLAEDVFEKRLENMTKELTGGISGIIGSILFPFSFVALLITIYNYKLFSRMSIFFIAFFGLYPFVETFFMGGRTTIALLGTTLIFIMYASFNKNSTFKLTRININNGYLFSFPSFLRKKRIVIPLVAVVLIFISYSVRVVNQRLDRFSYGDRTFKIWEQKDYQWVEFNDEIKKEYFTGTKKEKALIIGLHSIKHYFVHGVFEYIRLVNDLDSTLGYYYGQYQFNVFFKFFKALGVPLKSLEELDSVVNRQAVYTTFWGPFYIDFGVFGLIVMFFWGRFVKRIYVYAVRRETQYVIFYGYISTIIITSTFINFLQGSSSYYLFAFFVTLLAFKLWPNNLRMIVNEKA